MLLHCLKPIELVCILIYVLLPKGYMGVLDTLKEKVNVNIITIYYGHYLVNRFLLFVNKSTLKYFRIMNKLMRSQCATSFPLYLYKSKKTYSKFNEQIFNNSLFQLYCSLSLLF
jgi:hypothetical protein